MKPVSNEQTMIIHNLLLSSDEPSPKYLFKSQTNEGLFAMIEEEMRKLNDYCVICDRAAIEQLRKWGRLCDDSDPDDMSIWPELHYMGWKKTQETVVAGMVLMLLSAFVENTLKGLCALSGHSAGGNVRAQKNEPKVDAYIKFLRDPVGLRFREPRAWITYKKAGRNARNAFTHGDWSKCRAEIQGVDLSRAFGAASALFQEIDNANAKNPVISLF